MDAQQTQAERVAAMVRARWAGDTLDEVAQQHGLASAAAVLAALRGSDAPTAAQARAARQARRFEGLAELFEQGHDLQTAAQQLGLSVPVAQKVLDTAGPDVRAADDPRQQQRLAALQQQLADGASLRAAASAVDLSPWQACIVLHRAGLPVPRGRGAGPDGPSARRRDPRLQERDEQVCRDRAAGRTLEDIATEHGLTRERVRQIVQRTGGPSTAEVRQARGEQDRARLDELGRRAHDVLALSGPRTRAVLCEELGCSADDLRRSLSPQDARLVLTDKTAARRFSDEVVLDGLRALSAELAAEQGTAGQAQVSKYVWDERRDPDVLPSSIRIMQRWSTWNAACEAAGIPFRAQVSRSGPRPRWDDEECARWVARFLADPALTSSSYEEFDTWLRSRSGAPSAQTVRNRLGGWNEARRAAARLEAV